MDKIEELESQIKELKALLIPNHVELTEIDHLKAKFRVAFEELYDSANYMRILVEYMNNPTEDNWWIQKFGLEDIKKKAMKEVEFMENLLNESDNTDVIDQLVNPDMEKYYREAIDEMHCGDCTAIAASCSRCLAEARYKIPYTANWSKSEGSRYFHTLMKLTKDLEEIKKTKVSGF